MNKTVHHLPDAARQLGGATRHAASGGVSVTSWPAGRPSSCKLFALRSALNDEFRDAGVLVGQANLNDLFARLSGNRPDWRPMERIFARHAEFLKTARAPHRRPERPAGRRPPRHARQPTSVTGRDGPTCPSWARSDRCRPHVGLFGTIWGHHARLRRPGQPAAGDAGHRGARHRRGLVATAIGLLPPSRPSGLQPLRARHRPHRHRWRPSSKSSPTSCSATSAASSGPGH